MLSFLSARGHAILCSCSRPLQRSSPCHALELYPVQPAAGSGRQSLTGGLLGVQGAGATFSKGKLTWITEANMTERWIAAGCGNYTVLWNFRRVKQAKPTIISSGAFTITEHYSMIKKDEKVVQNAFMHDQYSMTPQAKNALVVATVHRLYNTIDEESSDFED